MKYFNWMQPTFQNQVKGISVLFPRTPLIAAD